jgi:tetratricopeptide (TPR) repeat protein
VGGELRIIVQSPFCRRGKQVLLERDAICPHCGQKTVIAIASPDSSGKFQQKGSLTFCRQCRGEIITVTFEDGSVSLLNPSDLGMESPDPGSEVKPQPSGSPKGPSDETLSSRSTLLSAPPRPREPTPPRLPADPEAGYTINLTDVLRRPDGSRRPHDEAVKVCGLRATWIAELNEALEVRMAGPKILSVPPRVFLSYRWASPEEDAWVEMLVATLRRRGYKVAFDRTDAAADLSVPEFVSRIADSHFFVAVLDPGYLERIGSGEGRTKDGWVFDEYNSAALLAQNGRLDMIGLLRKGVLPHGFRFAEPGKRGNAVDVRDAAKLNSALEGLFPPIPGLPAPEAIDKVEQLILASHHKAAEGQLKEAYSIAAQAADACPEIIDGHAQMARVAAEAGMIGEGLDAARKALSVNPDSLEMLSQAAGFAYYAGESLFAMECCVKIFQLDAGDPSLRYVAYAHYYLGNALDDLGQTPAGLAHLEIARRLEPNQATFCNDTSLAYRHIDDLPQALSCALDGLKLSPSDPKLLVNWGAAAIESGDIAQSLRALEQLAKYHPGHPSIEYLARVLNRLSVEGGSPPTLVPRQAPVDASGRVGCTICPAQIPIAAEDSVLCAGCGAEKSVTERTCRFCRSDGVVAPVLLETADIRYLCPYCREGSMTFEYCRRGN